MNLGLISIDDALVEIIPFVREDVANRQLSLSITVPIQPIAAAKNNGTYSDSAAENITQHTNRHFKALFLQSLLLNESVDKALPLNHPEAPAP